MKNNILIKVLYILAFLIITANTAISAVKSLTPDINDLPSGELLFSSVSPSGKLKVDFYIVKNNMGSAIRGELIDGDHRTNIYWQTGIDTADVIWQNDYSIIINELPINVLTDKFDSRRGTAIFSEGSTAEQITNNNK